MTITLIDRFYRAADATIVWPSEVARRAEGLKLKITRDYFFHMNPLYEPNSAMRYVVGRYEAAFDFIARLKPRSILEIGCAQGLSTWLMTSFAGAAGVLIFDDLINFAKGLQIDPLSPPLSETIVLPYVAFGAM